MYPNFLDVAVFDRLAQAALLPELFAGAGTEVDGGQLSAGHSVCADEHGTWHLPAPTAGPDSLETASSRTQFKLFFIG